MVTLELKDIAIVLKKAVSFFMPVVQVKTGVQVEHLTVDDYAHGGICRTPADSAVLRTNMEPWA